MPIVVNQQIEIDQVSYRVAEHPSAPGLPYGQEGRAATVYKLINSSDSRALKVFKPHFRKPYLVSQADQIRQYATLPGLEVCRRSVLTPRRHETLMRELPELLYSVLMPWVEGVTWFEIVAYKTPLTHEQSFFLGRAFSDVLAGMEERGIAHCDLSGSNIIFGINPNEYAGFNTDQVRISLVDVEGFYAPGLNMPEVITSGSPGYYHKTKSKGCLPETFLRFVTRISPQELWGNLADRFSGAVLLAEILGWCDPAVRQDAGGESYFSSDQIQKVNNSYDILLSALRKNWGKNVADLFAQAWLSDTLSECPSFGEWLTELLKCDAHIPANSESMMNLDSSPAAFTSPIEAEDSVPVQVALTSIQDLFDEANLAVENEQWSTANELLMEVLRRQPDFQRNRQSAFSLLKMVKGKLAGRKKSRTRLQFILPILFTMIIGVLLILGLRGHSRSETMQTQTYLAMIPIQSLTLTLTSLPSSTPSLIPSRTPTFTPLPEPTITLTKELSFTPIFTSTPLGSWSSVIVSTIGLRTDPDINSSILYSYPKGTILKIEGKSSDNSWFYVETPDGLKGWLYKDWVDIIGFDPNIVNIIELIPTATKFVMVYQNKVHVIAKFGWTDSHINVKAGQTFSIGYISNELILWGINHQIGYYANCLGIDHDSAASFLGNHSPIIKDCNLGALIARIGDGTPFCVNYYFSQQASSSGELFLGTNDLTPNSDEGDLYVGINVQ